MKEEVNSVVKINENEGTEICPRCDGEMHPPRVALSREDNETSICPECGTIERTYGFNRNMESEYSWVKDETNIYDN